MILKVISDEFCAKIEYSLIFSIILRAKKLNFTGPSICHCFKPLRSLCSARASFRDMRESFWGIGEGKSCKSLRPRKSIFPKLVRFLHMIYHSTRLGERFSNLFSDLKNLYAFKSYDQNTISIVDHQNSGYWL